MSTTVRLSCTDTQTVEDDVRLGDRIGCTDMDCAQRCYRHEVVELDVAETRKD